MLDWLAARICALVPPGVRFIPRAELKAQGIGPTCEAPPCAASNRKLSPLPADALLVFFAEEERV